MANALRTQHTSKTSPAECRQSLTLSVELHSQLFFFSTDKPKLIWLLSRSLRLILPQQCVCLKSGIDIHLYFFRWFQRLVFVIESDQCQRENKGLQRILPWKKCLQPYQGKAFSSGEQSGFLLNYLLQLWDKQQLSTKKSMNLTGI